MKPLTNGGRTMVVAMCTAVTVLLSPSIARATAILRVPQDYPTIQGAINAAADGDTVLVAGGTYDENINLGSKAITVASSDGAAATVIDGGDRDSVVRMIALPSTTRVLRGFTIRNGRASFLGAGVLVEGAYPYTGVAEITDNVVLGNEAGGAAGVYSTGAALALRGNTIRDNHQIFGYSGGIGAGVSVDSFAPFVVPIVIEHNLIEGNTINGSGAGLAVRSSGSLHEPNVTISRNIIRDNCSGSDGGGIYLDGSNALVVNNLVTGNRTSCGTIIPAGKGGGLWWNSPNVFSGPALVNNTFAGNEADDGSAVAIGGFWGSTIRMANNVLTGGGHSVLFCASQPVISYNDVYATGAAAPYGGTCPNATGTNGNVSQDPAFVAPTGGDFHLMTSSPAVDSGTNTGAPTVDLEGVARPQDGNGDGSAITDMGAYELAPPADSTPPTITCSAAPSMLWPPNHLLELVTVAISAADNSGSVTVTLLSVTSNQADSGLDNEDVPNDIQDWTTGRDDRQGYLRAERVRDVRVYTLTYEARDPVGNTSSCATTVTVPRNQAPA